MLVVFEDGKAFAAFVGRLYMVLLSDSSILKRYLSLTLGYSLRLRYINVLCFGRGRGFEWKFVIHKIHRRCGEGYWIWKGGFLLGVLVCGLGLEFVVLFWGGCRYTLPKFGLRA